MWSRASTEADRSRVALSARAAPGGYAYIVAATLFWGGSAVLARYLFTTGVPALVVVELRLLLATLALGAMLLLFRPAQLVVPRAQWWRLLVLGLFGVATVQGSYYTTVSLIGVGLAILLQYLAPALVVVYEGVTGRSPWTRPKLLALALATAGTALLVLADRGGTLRLRPLGVGLGLLSAVCFAFYILFAKATVSRLPQGTVNFYGFAVAAAWWALFQPPWKIVAAGYTIRQWELFVAVAVFSVLIPFALFYRGIARLESWRAAVTAMLEPVVAAVAAWIFLGEGLGPAQWGGATLLLAGVAWVQWEDRARRRLSGAARPRDDHQRDQ